MEDGLCTLGMGAPMARLLRYFAIRPDSKPHIRELQRILGVSSATIQRDLARLVRLGILTRQHDGRAVRHALDANRPLWSALRTLVSQSSDPTTLVRDALRDVSGIDAAFIFGSVARGADDAESDVDLLVIGDAVAYKALHRHLTEAGFLLHRSINTVRYTRQAFADRLGDASHAAAAFVRGVLDGPKVWVAGTPEKIAPITTAAGIPLIAEAA